MISNHRNINKYLITILITLSFYDIFLFLLLNFLNVKKLNISFIIIKVLFSLVINFLNIIVIYFIEMVLKGRKTKYKLM